MSRRFSLVLIKPSHYDDDGYVIQWLRSAIPSNTLAVLNGLALDCQQRRVLGNDVEIIVTALDETNTRVYPQRIARQLSGGRGLVAMVGVQSNQYPRAMDLARIFRSAGVQVCIGGFHVSGCLAMLPDIPPELKEALDLGISLFAGEAEGRFEEVLRDAWSGSLKPLYNFISDLPSLQGVPKPFLPPARVKRTAGKLAEAVRFSARFASSSMCRDKIPAAARRMNSKPSSAAIWSRESIASSSRMTTLRATRIGRACSTA